MIKLAFLLPIRLKGRWKTAIREYQCPSTLTKLPIRILRSSIYNFTIIVLSQKKKKKKKKKTTHIQIIKIKFLSTKYGWLASKDGLKGWCPNPVCNRDINLNFQMIDSQDK